MMTNINEENKPAPERRECFVNVYPVGLNTIHSTLSEALKPSIVFKLEAKLRWKITSDEDGSNPTIEVVEENE